MGRKSGELVTESFGDRLRLTYHEHMSAIPFAAKPLVLLVNDDEATRRLLKMAVRNAGWRCEDVANVEAGWATLEKMGVAALVVDVAMPDHAGVKFVGQLRAAGMRQPIICLTGAPIHELDLVNESGTFTALVRKPVNLEHLLGVLREGLGDSGNRDQAV
jgi:DNA-binding response OmpR family regulator